MRISHFNQAELAFRWRISPRTLERWRWSKTGPVFLKIGGRVIYRLEDIEAFERASIRCADDVGDAGSRHRQEPHERDRTEEGRHTARALVLHQKKTDDDEQPG